MVHKMVPKWSPKTGHLDANWTPGYKGCRFCTNWKYAVTGAEPMGSSRSTVGSVMRPAGTATDEVLFPGIAIASMAVVRALRLITYRNSR